MASLLERPLVRMPHFGRGAWLNTTHPLTRESLRGRPVLVDFWDYSCVNCVRSLPYLRAWHERYNLRHFDGRLSCVPLRISRRMTTRLGQYRISSCAGEPCEIVIARRHIERHGWHEALDTLLHEMIHQWQHESGLPVDHGPAFRRKALEVGTAPSATRPARRPLEPRRADDIFWPSVA